ncbi:MAG: hypothetical protein K8S62_07780 [Candidatus Sabulitectum sp.]|nr:hypothetical protein [Candidatus Sabulitectum sp.]
MKKIFILISFAVMISLSCTDTNGKFQTNTTGESQGDSTSSDEGITSEWREYLQSSDDGLWEDIEEHFISYNPGGYFTDPEAMAPMVYKPYSICTAGDTVFVADAGTQEIVALTNEGELIWKVGGAGEGPGNFSLVTTLAVSDRYVAALNINLGRIDFFYRDGSFSHCLNFTGAQDIAAIDDTTFVVGSTLEPGGDLHILNSEEGIIRSFGEAEMIHLRNVPRIDLLRICPGENNRIAVFNRYEGLLAIYDIETEECIYRGSRVYPSSPEDRVRQYPIGGNAFLGREGMINILFPNYMDDGSFLSDPDYVDFAQVTAVDRYDWDGNYLDSYCLPDSSLNYAVLLSDGRLVVRSFSEETLCIFDDTFQDSLPVNDYH